jgi:hypothetical protein
MIKRALFIIACAICFALGWVSFSAWYDSQAVTIPVNHDLLILTPTERA